MISFGSLFAGIGGFDLGLESAGMKCLWQVENNSFCQNVLSKHWPDVERFEDVKECGRHNLKKVDLVCGGFPCQPFSVAGKRRGKEDDRYLWPEMLRIVRELNPAWVIGENVTGITDVELEQMCLDMENEGYEVQPIDIPAAGVGAVHRRRRYWILANRKSVGRRGRYGEERGDVKRFIQPEKQERNKIRSQTEGRILLSSEIRNAARVLGVYHGLPNRLDRLRSVGNAVVPQLVEVIGKAIVAVESMNPPEVE